MVPEGFAKVPISELVERVAKPVDVVPDELYRQIGIRSHAKGLFDKDPVTGRSLGNKRVFWVEPDCFVVNIVFAWEQAVGKTTSKDVGKIASHRFPMYRAKPGICDIDYLTYLFKTKYGKHLLTLASPGGAGRNKTLGQTEFMKTEIVVPPYPEQQKIAEVLSTWDRAIETVEKLIANSRAQKKALMQRLLMNGDSNGEASRFQFKDIVDVDARSLGGTTPSDFCFEYISLADVETGRISPHLESLRFGKAPSRARRRLQYGDILMSTVRPNLQGFARVGKRHADCIASTGFAVLSARVGFDNDYIYHYLFGSHVTGQIHALVVGSNYPAINSSDVKGLAIYCPDLQQQNRISRILNAADHATEAYTEQLANLRAEKAALMQQLLTGKRRVKVMEDAA